MKFTYKIYMFNKDIEKYKNDIEIIAIKRMSMGGVVTFHCDNHVIVDEIFAE